MQLMRTVQRTAIDPRIQARRVLALRTVTVMRPEMRMKERRGAPTRMTKEGDDGALGPEDGEAEMGEDECKLASVGFAPW